MTDLAERLSFSVRELQSTPQLSLHDAVFGGQIFVPRQKLLVHRPRHVGKDASSIHYRPLPCTGRQPMPFQGAADHPLEGLRVARSGRSALAVQFAERQIFEQLHRCCVPRLPRCARSVVGMAGRFVGVVERLGVGDLVTPRICARASLNCRRTWSSFASSSSMCGPSLPGSERFASPPPGGFGSLAGLTGRLCLGGELGLQGGDLDLQGSDLGLPLGCLRCGFCLQSFNVSPLPLGIRESHWPASLR